MSHGSSKCPYCNRDITENERYCWNCEADLSKLRDEQEKPGKESHGH